MIPVEFKTATFILVFQGDGSGAELVHGWDALCAAWVNAHIDNPDKHEANEILAPMIDLDEWATSDSDGLPYLYSARYEDGTVLAVRITDGIGLGFDALDATRYRWLRSRDLETISRGGVFAGVTPENVVINGEDLDRHIDAARIIPEIERLDRQSEEATCQARGAANRDRLQGRRSVYEAAEKRANAAKKESGDAETT